MTTHISVRFPKMYQAGLYIVAAAVGGAVTAAVAQVSPFASLWVFWGMMVAGYIVAMMGRGPDANDVADESSESIPTTRSVQIAKATRGHFQLVRSADGKLWAEYFVGSLGQVDYAEMDRLGQLRAAAILLESIESNAAREWRGNYRAARLAIDVEVFQK